MDAVAEEEVFYLARIEDFVVFVPDGGVEIDEGHALLLGDRADDLGVAVGIDLAVLAAAAAGGQGEQERVGALGADLVDVDAQVLAVGVDALAGAVAGQDHLGVFLARAAQDAAEAAAVHLASAVLVIVAQLQDDPVAGPDGAQHREQPVLEPAAGALAAESVVLDRDAVRVEVILDEVAPAPLAVVAVAGHFGAHGGVADQEEDGVVALAVRAGDRPLAAGGVEAVDGGVDPDAVGTDGVVALAAGRRLGLLALRRSGRGGLEDGVLVREDHLAGPGRKLAVEGIGIEDARLGGTDAGQQERCGSQEEGKLFHLCG